jgi:hypothetical protein
MSWYHSTTTPDNTYILPSVRNENDVLVYIPWKGQTDGIEWVKPVTIVARELVCDHEWIYTFDDVQHIRLSVSTETITFMTPFSLAMLRHYTLEAAKMLRPVLVVLKDQRMAKGSLPPKVWDKIVNLPPEDQSLAIVLMEQGELVVPPPQ